MSSRPACGLALVASVLVLVAGCGGSGDSSAAKSDEEKVAEALADLEEELAKNPPGPGLGEGSPPPPDSASWDTDFSKALVPLDEFTSGGPPKDGIPAIDIPSFTAAREVDWLGEREPVILVEIDGEARGYPLQILMWHEIANDRIGSTPIAVTFCPLCNTAIVFDRRLDGETYDFGTTGKLRESDLVMYDRQTESWWQQFSGEALVGELAGQELEQIPARIVSWEELSRQHPDAPVLDRDTGFARDYGTNPYVGYDDVESSPIFATTGNGDHRLPPKERVVYVEVGERALAVPYSNLMRDGVVSVETGEGELVVGWRPQVASALDETFIREGWNVGAATVSLDGRPVPFHEPFWFAVAAFRPDIEIVDE
ncbi:MAG TPA: DUF3179 domain-containing protein [Gaiellaceae bacterium]|nr:DUF3179 domain-containing protein [Gaiellaceae bacterium]